MLATESLWLGKKEGVRVSFDSRRVTFARLLEHAGRTGCDRAIWTTTKVQQELAQAAIGNRAQPVSTLVGADAPRRDDEQQYYLLQTPLRFVPMTTAQATRINAAVGKHGYASSGWRRFLSPRQQRWWAAIVAADEVAWPSAQGVQIGEAVAKFRRAAAKPR